MSRPDYSSLTANPQVLHSKFLNRTWAMSWLPDLVSLPSTRRPLTSQSFLTELLPPILCYYATAVLVLLPRTFPIRLALLPISLWAAFRAATTIDLAQGYNEDGLAYLNHGLLLGMVTLALRVIGWTFHSQPYNRTSFHSSTEKTTHFEGISNGALPDAKHTFWDSFDLFFNHRGCGWNWSDDLHVAPQTRPTSSTFSFLMATLMSAIFHLLAFDALHYAIQSFSPSTIGSLSGGSIFDPSMPPFLRYLRSSTICLFSGFVVYCAIQTIYDVLTILGIVIFRQLPIQWPPIFNAPWLSTSLSEFWSKRWHQIFRYNLGAKRLSLVVGRVGAVIGAFSISGLFHDMGMWGMGRGSEFQTVGGFFVMMGVGVVLEGMWKKTCGTRVDGWCGRLWTGVWVIGWAHMLIDAWSRRGLIGSVFFADSVRPSKYFIGLIY